MCDITRIALNRVWRTGFGTFVHHQYRPFVGHVSEAPKARPASRSFGRLLRRLSPRYED